MMELFELASGQPLSQEEEGSARRMQLVIRATLASVLFAAFYGIAAGSTDLGLAMSNLYKMPMVILLSTACALRLHRRPAASRMALTPYIEMQNRHHFPSCTLAQAR